MSDFMTFFRERNSNVPPTLTPRDILWNFPDAEVLNLSAITVQGSVLAPWADVVFTNGNIDGSMIAKNVTGRGEFHDFLFRHELECPPVDDGGGPGGPALEGR